MTRQIPRYPHQTCASSLVAQLAVTKILLRPFHRIRKQKKCVGKTGQSRGTTDLIYARLTSA